MPTIIAMIASGLFQFFNRTIVTGLLGKLIFTVLLAWVINTLLGGIVGMIASYLNVPTLASLLGSWGSIGAFAFYLFTITIQPGLSIAIASRVVVFTIRRLPIVG